MNNGLCVHCGKQCYSISRDTISNDKCFTGLTVTASVVGGPGVSGGQCLNCYPLPTNNNNMHNTSIQNPNPVLFVAAAAHHEEEEQQQDELESVNLKPVPVAVVSSPDSANTAASEDEESTATSTASMPVCDNNHDHVATTPVRRILKRSKRRIDDTEQQDDRKMPARSTPAAKRKNNNSSSNNNNLSSTPKRIVTPGFCPSPQEGEMKERRNLSIKDYEGRIYSGHISKGSQRLGVGLFEYAHKGDDDDNDVIGKVSIYEGSFSKGTLNGTGKLIHARGNVYEGDFKDGACHGFGTSVWPTGWKYTGQWVGDERQGKGKLCEIDMETGEEREEYDGEWVADKYHGKGKLTQRGGKQWCVGSFVNHEIHGETEYFWEDGSEYHGTFEHDVRSGWGQMRYSDGCSYLGKWKGNKRNGMGTELECDGTCFKGVWKDDARYEGWHTGDIGGVKMKERYKEGVLFKQKTKKSKAKQIKRK